jgi:hypothetical protein
MPKRKTASAIWAREVQKAMNAPAPPTTRSRAEIEADIAAISEELRGPMPNVVRLDLVEARAVLRNQLDQLST